MFLEVTYRFYYADAMKDSSAMSGSGGVGGASAHGTDFSLSPGGGQPGAHFSSPVDVLVISRFDYKATDAHELSIRKNEKLRLLDDTQHWWRVMNSQGQCGYVPSNYVKKSKQGLFSSLRNTLGRRKKRDQTVVGGGTASASGTGSTTGMHRSRGDSPASANSTGHRPSSPNPSGNLSYPRGSSIIQSPPAPQMSMTGHPDAMFGSPIGMSTPNTSVVAASHTSSSHYNNGSTGGPSGLRLPTTSIQDETIQICTAKFAYVANQSDELSLSKGDRIEVYEKSTDGWWRGKKAGGEDLGWFPSNYVVQQTSQSGSGGVQPQTQPQRVQTTGSTASTGADSSSCDYNNCGGGGGQPALETLFTVVTLYPFSKNHTEELDFEADEVLHIVEKPANDPDWWRARNVRGDMGLVPRNYVRVISTAVPASSGLPGGLAAPASGLSMGQAMLGTGGPGGGSRGSTMRSGTGFGGNQTGDELRRSYNPKGLYPDKDWYWGIVSRLDCEAMLAQHARIGQFAVRDSESHPGDLTITMFTGTKNRNFKVRLEGGQYCIGQKVFDTLDDLIQHYRTHPIYKSEQEKHYLTQPFKHPGLTCS